RGNSPCGMAGTKGLATRHRDTEVCNAEPAKPAETEAPGTVRRARRTGGGALCVSVSSVADVLHALGPKALTTGWMRAPLPRESQSELRRTAVVREGDDARGRI